MYFLFSNGATCFYMSYMKNMLNVCLLNKQTTTKIAFHTPYWSWPESYFNIVPTWMLSNLMLFSHTQSLIYLLFRNGVKPSRTELITRVIKQDSSRSVFINDLKVRLWSIIRRIRKAMLWVEKQRQAGSWALHHLTVPDTCSNTSCLILSVSSSQFKPK